MTITNLLTRILRADPDELRERIGQRAYLEQMRVACAAGLSPLPPLGHLRSLEISSSDVPGFVRSGAESWFLTSSHRAHLREYFTRHTIEAQRIVDRADEIVQGKMRIFAHEPVAFVGADRWRRDHILGVSAPQKFFADISYLDSTEVGDSKNLWEPNRFFWVYWLGPAYLITGRASFAETFCNLLQDWLDQNPYPLGINYSSALEVSFRAYAWLWALDFFREELTRRPQLAERLIEAIWISAIHLEHNLSHYFSPNTHLTGEAFGLYAIGSALPQFAEAARWRSLGEAILVSEASRQFHRDGAHRELSSCYHLYSTDFYVQAALIGGRAGQKIHPIIPERASAMAIRLAQLAPDDYILPQFNDCDGGRLTWFEFDPLDAAPTLFAAASSLGVVLNTHQRAPGGYNLWMATDQRENASASRVSVEESPQSHATLLSSHATVNTKMSDIDSKETDPDGFGAGNDVLAYDSGIVTYRNQAGDYLLFRAGSFGYGECGHSHDAPTSFILRMAGEKCIEDNGTGAYTQDISIRNEFRSARGKNIALVDGAGPSVPDGWFGWKSFTQGRIACARTFPGGYYIKGGHTGFRAAKGFSVQIDREVALFDEGIFILVDSWKSERPIAISINLCFHPLFDLVSPGRMISQKDGRSVHYLTVSKDGPAESAVTAIPYSPSYGVIGESKALTIQSANSQQGFVMTIISRVGEVWRARDKDSFGVGEEGNHFELHAGPSGKVSLLPPHSARSTKRGVDFVR